MVRPRSSSKVSKKHGGAGSGKRKYGHAPQGGSSGGRPAKQSRREGKSKSIDPDIYEAEDSDPDEVKHAGRFDKVDNYEYELPSDFEDEEIDEELAFTEEDKKKFGGLFEKELSADEDEGGDGDNEGWDDEGYEEEEDDKDRPTRVSRTTVQGRDAEEDDEDGEDEELVELSEDDGLYLNNDDDEDIDALGEDEEDEDAIGSDDERHRAMLQDILGDGMAVARKARRNPNAAVVSEAYPESQYNLNPGAASAGGTAAGILSVADLLQSLTSDERKKLGASRQLLEKVAGVVAGSGGKAGGKGLQPVSVPLPVNIAERQERKAGYEAASKDVTKWQSIVKTNREAPTLRLVSGRDEVPRINTTAAIVAQHTPSADNALEAEVAALLEAAGGGNAQAIAEAEEELAIKRLSLEEARERRTRLAKLRSLLFYHELKARRLKTIKSKEYHRHLARAAKRKASKLAAAAAAAGGNEGDVDAERVAAIEAEYQRAKERLTLRHRNSSRWARRVLKRGQLQMDEGTKAALAEQLQLGQELKRKIEGRKGGDDSGDGSGSDGSTSASDSEEEPGGAGGDAGGAGGRHGGKVRSAALELLSGGGPLDLDGEGAPRKGLLALPFMKRALERRRLQAKQEAEEVLKELEEQQMFREQDDEDEDDRDRGLSLVGKGEEGGADGLVKSLVGYSVPHSALASSSGGAGGGRRRFGGGKAELSVSPAAADMDVDAGDGAGSGSGLDSDDVEDVEAKAQRLGWPTKEEVAVASKQRGKKARKKGEKASTAPLPTAADEADLDAVIAAGAAGRGLLVVSSDLKLELAVGQEGAVDGDEDDGNAERRETGRKASTRAASCAKMGEGGVLREVASQQASLAVGGGRAALFQAAAEAGLKAGGGADVDGHIAAAAAGGKGKSAKNFIRAEKFEGARPGYVFQKGQKGLGYYWDKKCAAAAAGPASAANKADVGSEKQRQNEQEVTVAGQSTQEKQRHTRDQQEKQGTGQQGARKQQKQRPRSKDPVEGGDEDGDDEEDGPMMRPQAAANQRDLIRQAFAGDDVEAEFRQEKSEAVSDELPKMDEPSTLPGWGRWGTSKHEPMWMQKARLKQKLLRDAAAKNRKDANLKYVMVSEKWDKKASKYTAPTAPFPFTSREAYERSIRQPLGREYNPDTAFRDLTRPAVLKQAGVTIAPLRYSEPIAKDLGRSGKKAVAAREAQRVITVAGGMIQRGKKSK